MVIFARTPGWAFWAVSLRPMMNSVFNLNLVVIIITKRVIDLCKGETMNTGDFFGVFARLKEQDDMTHTCTSSFNNRLSTIDSGITNNIGMRGAFNAHRHRPFLHLCVVYSQIFRSS